MEGGNGEAKKKGGDMKEKEARKTERKEWRQGRKEMMK